MLQKSLQTLLKKNSRELSTVEGNILSAARDREIKTILVTSSTNFEGKTISAISMAYGLATETNAKVLLVDGNLHSPKLYELFEVNSAPGLSDLFISKKEKYSDAMRKSDVDSVPGLSDDLYVSKAEYSDVIRKTEDENLMIMTHGSETTSTLDVFKSKLFKEKLDFLRQKFDYVIFDGRSILGSSDSSVVAKYFDGVILVVECEKTRREVFLQAKEKINNVGGFVLGAVLSKRKYHIPKMLYGKI